MKFKLSLLFLFLSFAAISEGADQAPETRSGRFPVTIVNTNVNTSIIVTHFSRDPFTLAAGKSTTQTFRLDEFNKFISLFDPANNVSANLLIDATTRTIRCHTDARTKKIILN